MKYVYGLVLCAIGAVGAGAILGALTMSRMQQRLNADGMVLLSAIVVPMAMLASWRIQERVPLSRSGFYLANVALLQKRGSNGS